MNAAQVVTSAGVRVTEFPKVKQVIGEVHDFDNFEALAQTFETPRVYQDLEGTAADKVQKPADLALWSPATFSDNHRSKANVQTVAALVLDFDEGISVDCAAKAMGDKGVSGFLHTTFNHRESRHCFRLVIEVERPMSPAELRQTQETVGPWFGQAHDKNAVDAARAFYEPAKLTGQPYEFRRFEGHPLPVTAAAAVPQSPQGTTAPPAHRVASPDALELFESVCKSHPVAVQGKAGQAVLYGQIAARAQDLGLSAEEACQIAWKVFNPRCAPPWRADERQDFERQIQQGYKNGTSYQWPADDPGILALNRWFSKKYRDAAPSNDACAPDEALVYGIFLPDGWAERAREPPKFVVQDYLVEGTLTLVAGAPGSKKTWFALSLLHAVQSGEPWLGKYATKKGPVVFLDYESGRTQTSARLESMKACEPKYYAEHPQQNSADLRKALEGMNPAPRLVVIDSLRAQNPNVDENDSRIGALVQEWKNFASRTGASVVILHHTSKAGDVRGSNAIEGAADVVWTIEADGARSKVVPRQKTRFDPIKPLEFTVIDGKVSLAATASAGVREQDLEDRILLLVKQRPGELTKSGLRELVKGRTIRVDEAVQALVERGELRVVDKKLRPESEQLRHQRVQETLRNPARMSFGELARLAGVPQDFLTALQNSGRLTKSGGTFFYEEAQGSKCA